ncbi:LOW QUALITY PROTEIN: uncharacterized protein LOC116668339, partial [Camelus ferus]|uniref:LOW QUALITY PROTEIN: uncharacterized protein LOC116668339 n=1 Tax=Camelus ferus TaxID=419612 RepID=A0A8B8UCA6_CAMFR
LSPIPHFPPLNPRPPSPSPLLHPHPPAPRSCCTFPSPRAPQPPRCTPNPFTARPHRGKKGKSDEPTRGATRLEARRKGEGEGTYFSRRGADRCRQEIKARIRAAWNPADAVVSALRSGWRWRWRPQGTGTGARAARLAGARAALRLGPRLRAAPLLAPLWLLAPTPGSHMTPAPLALRASRGWRAPMAAVVLAPHLAPPSSSCCFKPFLEQERTRFTRLEVMLVGDFCSGRGGPPSVHRELQKILFKCTQSQQVHQKAIEHLLEHITPGEFLLECCQGFFMLLWFCGSGHSGDGWSLSGKT